MFVETMIYIRYVVLTIVTFTAMLAIELIYPTQLFHLMDVSLCTYIFFTLIGLWHIFDKGYGFHDILAIFLR